MLTGFAKPDLLGWIVLAPILLVTFLLIAGCRNKRKDRSPDTTHVAITSMRPVAMSTPPKSSMPNVRRDETRLSDPPATGPTRLTQPALSDNATAYEHYLKALEHRNLGEYSKAAAEFAQVIDASPHFWKAYVNLARTQIKQGKPAEAVKSCDTVLKIRTDVADIYNVRGLGYLEQGMYREAIVDFERAIALNAKAAWPHNNLGLVHLRQGETDKALQEFRLAVKLSPKTALMRNNLGAALESTGSFGAAKKEYEAALELDPNYAKASNGLARVAPLTRSIPQQIVCREAAAGSN